MESGDSVRDSVLDPKNDDDPQSVSSMYTYEDGDAIYTDPKTGSQFRYQWDSEEKKWVPKTSSQETIQPEYEKDGDTYTFKDEATGAVLVWDSENKKWKTKKEKTVLKRQRNEDDEEEFDSDDNGETEQELEKRKASIAYHVEVSADGKKTYRDPSDGTLFEWDVEKKAWFPKLDDEFLARYQLNYGDPVTEAPVTIAKLPLPEPEKKEAKKPSEPSWFEVDETKNTKVYVSNLPLSTTEEEFVALMSKYGLVEKDLETQKLKIKLYKDSDGRFKGDALCTFIKIESVDLCLNLMDGSVIGDHTVHVERAKFTLKGAYDPTKKPRKRKKKDLEKIKIKQEKLLDWRPDRLRGERSNNENVVILKRLFKPVEFENDPASLIEIQQDLREECAKFGRVKRLNVFDRNEDGVAQVFFRTPEEADRCIAVLHGRWFGGQKITAETWDGVTKYRKDETKEEAAERHAKWSEFLTKGEEEHSD